MNFPKNASKTTERHSLAVCDSLFGEKKFLLLFILYYWFVQKEWFKHIQILDWICPFQTW